MKKGIDKKRHHESQKWKRSKARFKAESFAAEGKPISRFTETIGNGVADIPTELLRVVGAQSGRQQPSILEQPGGDIHGSGGMSEMPHVRYAFGGRPQMPQVQEHCFA